MDLFLDTRIGYLMENFLVFLLLGMENQHNNVEDLGDDDMQGIVHDVFGVPNEDGYTDGTNSQMDSEIANGQERERLNNKVFDMQLDLLRDASDAMVGLSKSYYEADKLMKKLGLGEKRKVAQKMAVESPTKDGYMRHPADSPAWSTFDSLHSDFADESRNELKRMMHPKRKNSSYALHCYGQSVIFQDMPIYPDGVPKVNMHVRFLPKEHEFRKSRRLFDGTVEYGEAPQQLSGDMIFPSSLFDVMVHLTLHLATEVKLCGLVLYRWMYPVERYLSTLKSYVRNRSKPESSIAKDI
ncbi:hypothetical protein SASPL_115013 [Salvia splendens]|uniref:DUF4218 domain-containing protein n=1 Tax=Salvia splendens TaxID=180675 RepID=A0A8X8Y6Q3_SALSN|nr:hypothetical protein SASPL_115013 [Salvia splendens]